MILNEALLFRVRGCVPGQDGQVRRSGKPAVVVAARGRQVVQGAQEDLQVLPPCHCSTRRLPSGAALHEVPGPEAAPLHPVAVRHEAPQSGMNP